MTKNQKSYNWSICSAFIQYSCAKILTDFIPGLTEEASGNNLRLKQIDQYEVSSNGVEF